MGCADDGRPSHLPVVETDPRAVDGARRAVLARLASAPLPALRGRVVFSTVPAGRTQMPMRAFANAGRPVHGAVVRFGAFSTDAPSGRSSA